MAEWITLLLTEMDVGQILDGLEQRRILWQATADYLANEDAEVDVMIEECSDSHEAQTVADYYQCIIDTIRTQRATQSGQKGDSTAN